MMPRGARSKYDTHVKPKLALIQGWARNGLILEEIAGNLGIAVQTLLKYRDEHDELLEALKVSLEEADLTVENALFRNATGYFYTEEVLSNQGFPVEVRKYQHPNTTAQIFWLKNRKSVVWRDKQEHKVDVDLSLADVLSKAWESANKDD